MAELIVALDMPDTHSLPTILQQLEQVDYFKVGLELYTADGHKAIEMLKKANKRIFLDLKLHDIPKTVENTVRAAAQLDVDLLTVHACGGTEMLKAAASAAADCGERAPKLIAVTTLTSLNEHDFADLGIQRTLTEQALRLGELALDAGIDGLVTSVLEAPDLRDRFGSDPLLITPGIRPGGTTDDDQKRIATPAGAVQAGSSYLVVGRPIMHASDPAAAAQAILDEIQQAVS